MKGVTEAAQTGSEVVKKTSSLWGKVVENAKWAKNAILNWSTKFKNMKYIKPLVESKAFKCGAGALGYGFGFVTLISGLSDISRVTIEAVNSKIGQ